MAEAIIRVKQQLRNRTVITDKKRLGEGFANLMKKDTGHDLTSCIINLEARFCCDESSLFRGRELMSVLMIFNFLP